MYKNLMREKGKSLKSWKQISEETGIRYPNLTTKVYKGTGFSVDQAIAVRKALNTEMPIEELFVNEDD